MKTFKTNLKRFELKKIQTEFPNVKITSSRISWEFIRQFYGDDMEIYESFFILLLNNANNTIGYAKISQGGVTGTYVDVRIVAKYVVESLATGIILAHNHPSGNLQPSGQDVSLTKRLKQAMELLECKVIDHIILTEKGYFSFVDENLI